jgi:predicted nucleotidyltransferase
MLKKYALFRVADILINTAKELSLREIAKKADVGAATSKACLDYLKKKDIVKRKIIGKSHLYSLNLDNFVVKHMKILNSLSIIKDSGLVKELLENYKTISSIALYGSLARGEDTEKSDIDILIISRKPIKLNPLKSEKKINKEIVFIIYTLPEWRKKAETDKPFYDRVIMDGIVLYGEKPVVR